jgi:hypothetical protein
MNTHQIIYTSCKRGIAGDSDGFQVYSHDSGMSDSQIKEVEYLFDYQCPAGVVITDEIVPTMPKSFVFNKLDSGKYVLALRTYLGRDYIGVGSRFGNFISHVILSDGNEISKYPCEYYNSELLLSGLPYEKVNNSEKPEYLNQPSLDIIDTSINLEAAVSFLNEDNRSKIYRNMLCALIDNADSQKGIVICDTQENIVLWISALSYTFPKEISLNITFNTYERDPRITNSVISGVVPAGTEYSTKYDEICKSFVVFDILNNSLPEFDTSNDFYDFAEISLTFSYDSILEFHNFLMSNFTYRKIDKSIIELYRVFVDFSNTDLTEEQIKRDINCFRKYSNNNHNKSFTNLIAKQLCNTKLNDKLFIELSQYLLDSEIDLASQDIISKQLISRIKQKFSDLSVDEQTFYTYIDDFSRLTVKLNLNIMTEMSLYRIDLLQAIQAPYIDEDSTSIINWRLSYFINILIESFIKSQSAENCEIIPSEVKQKFADSPPVFSLIVERCLSRNVTEILDIIDKLFTNNEDNTAFDVIYTIISDKHQQKEDRNKYQILVEGIWSKYFQLEGYQKLIEFISCVMNKNDDSAAKNIVNLPISKKDITAVEELLKEINEDSQSIIEFWHSVKKNKGGIFSWMK